MQDFSWWVRGHLLCWWMQHNCRHWHLPHCWTKWGGNQTEWAARSNQITHRQRGKIWGATLSCWTIPSLVPRPSYLQFLITCSIMIRTRGGGGLGTRLGHSLLVTHILGYSATCTYMSRVTSWNYVSYKHLTPLPLPTYSLPPPSSLTLYLIHLSLSLLLRHPPLIPSSASSPSSSFPFLPFPVHIWL